MLVKMGLASGLQISLVHFLATWFYLTTSLLTFSSMKPLPSLLLSTGCPPFIQLLVVLQFILIPLTHSIFSIHFKHPNLTTLCSCLPHQFELNMELTVVSFSLKANAM